MSVIQCWHVDGSSDLSATMRLLTVKDLAAGIPADEKVVIRSALTLTNLQPTGSQGKATTATEATTAATATAGATFKTGTSCTSSSRTDSLSAGKQAVISPSSVSFLTLHLRSTQNHSHADVLLQCPTVLASLPFLSSLVAFFAPGTADGTTASSASDGAMTKADAASAVASSARGGGSGPSAPSWLDCYHISLPYTAMEPSGPWVLTSSKPLLVDAGSGGFNKDGFNRFVVDGRGGEMRLQFDGRPLIYVAERKHLRFKNIRIIVSACLLLLVICHSTASLTLKFDGLVGAGFLLPLHSV